MLKTITLLLLLSTLVFSKDVNVKKDWELMSANERASIYRSYLNGRPYDLGLTLAAINWVESKGGRWQISTDHKDFGIYHINIYWYLKELKIKDTMYNRSKYSTIIMTKPSLSESYVVSKLLNLLAAYDNNYYKVWWRYNGSEEYSKKVNRRVKFLRKLFNIK